MSDETKAEKSENADDNSVSQPIAKPNVVCSQSHFEFEDALNKCDGAKIISVEIGELLIAVSYKTQDGKTDTFIMQHAQLIASCQYVMTREFKSPLGSQLDFHTSHRTLC